MELPGFIREERHRAIIKGYAPTILKRIQQGAPYLMVCAAPVYALPWNHSMGGQALFGLEKSGVARKTTRLFSPPGGCYTAGMGYVIQPSEDHPVQNGKLMIGSKMVGVVQTFELQLFTVDQYNRAAGERYWPEEPILRTCYYPEPGNKAERLRMNSIFTKSLEELNNGKFSLGFQI